jgi:hypothetical protein
VAYARLMQGTEAGEIQAAGRCIGYAMASECCSAPLEAYCEIEGSVWPAERCPYRLLRGSVPAVIHECGRQRLPRIQ